METILSRGNPIRALVSQESYETLLHAALLTGTTVDQFLVQSALKEARLLLDPPEVIPLSARDWHTLLDLIEDPPEPNVLLQSAMDHYQKAKRDDAGHSFAWEP
ncbi:MAG: DUF1778 domain-containing protein [Magnetococcales bacterium]|nr:DUF1778 domain-containing protein [Magnetococcales bacterium]